MLASGGHDRVARALVDGKRRGCRIWSTTWLGDARKLGDSGLLDPMAFYCGPDGKVLEQQKPGARNEVVVGVVDRWSRVGALSSLLGSCLRVCCLD